MEIDTQRVLETGKLARCALAECATDYLRPEGFSHRYILTTMEAGRHEQIPPVMTFSSRFSFSYAWTTGDIGSGTFHVAKRAALERVPIGLIVSH